MAITISGSGITSANIADGTIVNADVNDVAASKLTGALPAIDGSSLTNLPAGGKVAQVLYSIATNGQTIATTTYTDMTSLPITITPTAGSKLIFILKIGYHMNHSEGFGVNFKKTGGASTDSLYTSNVKYEESYDPGAGGSASLTTNYILQDTDSLNEFDGSTAFTYTPQVGCWATSTIPLNATYGDSSLVVWEVLS